MQYKSEFKSLRRDTIKITITTPKEGEDVELVLSGKEPVTIDYQADDIFKPLKMSGCSVTVLTKEPLLDLYTGTLNQVTLHVYRNNTLIWFGFLTPNVYTSAYKDVFDELTLEFVDPLSAMENVKYKRVNNGQWRSFAQYISGALAAVGANTELTTISWMSDQTDIRTSVGCMERNFIDETDDDSNAMTQQEVMEEICRYLGVQAICYGSSLLLIDTSKSLTALSLEAIGLANNNVSISLGSVYNRVTVIENTNPLDSDEILDSELMNDNNMQSIMWESHENPYYDFTVGAYNVNLDYDGGSTDFRALYRPKAASGWWMLGNTPIMATAGADTKRLATDSVVDGNYNFVEKGAFVLYTCSYQNSNVPSKLSFKKSVMMFCDRTSLHTGSPESSMSYDKGLNSTPFLGYRNIGHNIVLKGGYLVLAMKYKYLPQPMTELEKNMDDVGSSMAVSYFNQAYNSHLMGAPALDAYGRDYFMAKLKIGNKYWDGEKWTTTESTFNLLHTWKGTENIFNIESSLDNTNTYRKKLGDDIEGYAIPVASDGLFGNVEFEICPPSYFGKGYVVVYSEWDDAAQQTSYSRHWANPIGCCEITELKLAYCTQKKNEESLVLDTETKSTDIKVTGTMNVENIIDMDDIEMKVNTWSDLQNSYSYAIQNNSGDMKYYIPTLKPEVRLINRLIDYYSQPMLQYQATLKNLADKPILPYSQISIAAFSHTFAVTTINYDLQNNSAEVTLNQID